MNFWAIVKVICNIPLGVAAICASCIFGMVAFVVCCYTGHCIWIILKTKDNEIAGQKRSNDAQEEQH